MNIAQIENNLQNLLHAFNRTTFIYDLILSYGLPKASITRLQNGNLNLSKNHGEIAWKKKLLFREIDREDLHQVIDSLRSDSKSLKHDPRFVIVTDYKTLLAVDTKTEETIDIEIKDIAKHYDFFLPWAGMEKAQHHFENPADVRAAERMAKLYDEIKKDNPTNIHEDVHGMNVFLTRLLFCFFAEDTEIFDDGLFTKSISSHTQADGSDLNIYLEKLFEVLNTQSRSNLPAYLELFPYVNGGLFRDNDKVPVFTRRSRQAIIESGELDWSAINPDIFGSMIQAVVTPEHRGSLGMHYTSVPNILNVIRPLFLDELHEAFNRSQNNENKLKDLLERLSKIKIFDPACGSGNFLIIAYKEIRRIEMKIIKQLNVISVLQSFYYSQISLSQFYGIELDDFAHEVAILSLWLAEHQMNVEFFNEFGRTKPTLPLQASGKIIRGNATRLKWEEVCPKEESYEIYILGNPPYLGARLLNYDQKGDMSFVFNESRIKYNDLDYIACWFYKGAKYIKDANAKFAFVSTNSICQGAQVSLIWPDILDGKLEIAFAHQSFKWSNNARAKAAVICVIIGLRNKSLNSKSIYNNKLRFQVKNISPYLVEGDDIFISGRSKPIAELPQMNFGNMPNDGGHLLLSQEEYNAIVETNPEAKRFIRKFMGSREFINGIEKWCIWIKESDFNAAMQIAEIRNRVRKVENHRHTSKREATQNLSTVPFRFAEIRHKDTNSIIIPRHSSELREYIPIGFLNSESIIGDSALAIYDAEPWMFGIITSRIHMVWVRAVAGRLKTDYRYSAQLCYNTFPFPEILDKQKTIITEHLYQILAEREAHSEKTLAQLYDPKKMPKGLRLVHHQIDLIVESCYRSKPFESDEERLIYLFNIYEKMISKEKGN